MAVWFRKCCRHTQERVFKSKVQMSQWSCTDEQRVGGQVSPYNTWHVLGAHSSHQVGWEASTEISWETVVPTKTTVTFNKNLCHGCQNKLVKIVHFQATWTKSLGGLKSPFKRLPIRAKRNVPLIYSNTGSSKWQICNQPNLHFIPGVWIRLNLIWPVKTVSLLGPCSLSC